MSQSSVIEVEVRAAVPTSGGCAVFLGNEDKAFVIYIDQMVGAAILMFMRGVPKERPQTHDLFSTALTALGAKVQRVIINDAKDGVFFGRLILQAENELSERKIIELDARPSDCIALATEAKAPIYVARSVWDSVDDVSELLAKMDELDLDEGNEPTG